MFKHTVGKSSFHTPSIRRSIPFEIFKLIKSLSEKIVRLFNDILDFSLKDKKTSRIVKRIKKCVNKINDEVSTLIWYDEFKLSRFEPETTSLRCERHRLGLEIIRLLQELQSDRQTVEMD